MTAHNEPAPVVEIANVPACPRCSGECLLQAKMPSALTNVRGARTRGYFPFVLCPTCDFDSPTAGAVVTFFHVHGQVSADTTEQFADLIAAWLATLQVPTVTPAAFEADIAAWQAGEFDE